MAAATGRAWASVGVTVLLGGPMAWCNLLVFTSLLSAVAGFQLGARPASLPSSVSLAALTGADRPPFAPLAPVHPQQRACRAAPPAMGLFGLGWAEIGVIGVLALLFFGPDKLAPLAKDIGKSAAGLKEVMPDISDASSAAMAAAKDVTASFQEGMAEGEAGLTDKGDNAKKAEGSEVPPEKKDAA